MGLVLDSSVLITSERQRDPIGRVLAKLQADHGETEVVISAITVVELEHGLHRAESLSQVERRRAYLDKIFTAIPVEPISKEIGQLVGRIDAEARRRGEAIPFADLLIGGTALHLGYGIVTLNPRHFRMIPGLRVLSL